MTDYLETHTLLKICPECKSNDICLKGTYRHIQECQNRMAYWNISEISNGEKK